MASPDNLTADIPHYQQDGITIYHADCRDILPTLPESSCVVTSPPYAEQRIGEYASVAEADYPAFTVGWLGAVRLADTGSAIVNVRPHLSGGYLSTYVLRTRLALVDAGWGECEELIWYKSGGGVGPFGSRYRPRRAWESLLWLSRTGSPWVDVKANGTPTQRTLDRGPIRKGEGGYLSKIGPQTAGDPTRCEDVIDIPAGRWTNLGAAEHPAPFPARLAAWCINLICPPGGIVLDPFAGSGSTLEAARLTGHRASGIDTD